eukprot:scaffold153482_cov27-Prasinocladus_malaysianus.AAC.2
MNMNNILTSVAYIRTVHMLYVRRPLTYIRLFMYSTTSWRGVACRDTTAVEVAVATLHDFEKQNITAHAKYDSTKNIN